MVDGASETDSVTVGFEIPVTVPDEEIRTALEALGATGVRVVRRGR